SRPAPVFVGGKRKRPLPSNAPKKKKKNKSGKKTVGAGLLRTKKSKRAVVASPGAEEGDYGFNF
ncbi:hypothetical protein TrRE_jg9566, partial [Triparma retinervis]